MRTGRAASARVIALYASGFCWNVCMGALQVLVPLSGLSLGYSIVTISSLVSLPVLIELVVRFGGSAFSDRFGERRTLRACFLMMGLARSEEHTSELQSLAYLVCRLLLERKRIF